MVANNSWADQTLKPASHIRLNSNARLTQMQMQPAHTDSISQDEGDQRSMRHPKRVRWPRLVFAKIPPSCATVATSAWLHFASLWQERKKKAMQHNTHDGKHSHTPTMIYIYTHTHVEIEWNSISTNYFKQIINSKQIIITYQSQLNNYWTLNSQKYSIHAIVWCSHEQCINTALDYL